jgi:hypothetical protein
VSRLQFDSSPLFIFLCLAVGAGYAFLLYQQKHPWSTTVNRLLLGSRALLVSALTFLLLGPILKWTQTTYENPTFVFLVDNSASVKETTDSVARLKWLTQLEGVKKQLEEQDYSVSITGLDDDLLKKESFDHPSSDLSSALHQQWQKYEGKNLAGIVLLSDGIYNQGISPLYAPVRQPVYTVGMGDTIEQTDIQIKTMVYNKIAYQGNQFPIRADVIVTELPDTEIVATLSREGKVMSRQTKNSGTSSLLSFDFTAVAETKGMQRVEVSVSTVPGERNTKNNRAVAFVEVVEGKRKILLIAPAPHPDIKALRSVIEQNQNYELFVHIPGLTPTDPALLQAGQAPLVIFHQPLDQAGKTQTLFNQLVKQSSVLLLVGTQSNLEQLALQGIPISFQRGNSWDQVSPVVNPGFKDFVFDEQTPGAFTSFPPIQAPFGKVTYPPNAQILLFQQIGSVVTDRPLLLSWEEGPQKRAVLTGEGIWRWRLHEFADRGNTEAFDEVFSKLIQYLSTTDDKRRFKSFPVQNEFTESESVLFESQVYNTLFEPIYGFTIDLTITDETGKVTPYRYITSPGSTRYRIGGLTEGIYRYRSTTVLDGKREETRGEFLVTAQSIEAQNLTADFGLLRKLADETGGRFYSADQIQKLATDLPLQKAKAIVRAEDEFHPLIRLKWIFIMLLILVSLEWFTRKFLGAY